MSFFYLLVGRILVIKFYYNFQIVDYIDRQVKDKEYFLLIIEAVLVDLVFKDMYV